jgi:hypothetical protein
MGRKKKKLLFIILVFSTNMIYAMQESREVLIAEAPTTSASVSLKDIEEELKEKIKKYNYELKVITESIFNMPGVDVDEMLSQHSDYVFELIEKINDAQSRLPPILHEFLDDSRAMSSSD